MLVLHHVIFSLISSHQCLLRIPAIQIIISPIKIIISPSKIKSMAVKFCLRRQIQHTIMHMSSEFFRSLEVCYKSGSTGERAHVTQSILSPLSWISEVDITLNLPKIIYCLGIDTDNSNSCIKTVQIILTHFSFFLSDLERFLTWNEQYLLKINTVRVFTTKQLLTLRIVSTRDIYITLLKLTAVQSDDALC